MKSFPWRRVLASVVLLSVIGVGIAVWQLGSEYGRRRIAQAVRQGLTHNSELVLGPFDVEFSPWRDFPHLTASISHISLADTSYQQQVPVLTLGRADLRLEFWDLLRGKVQVRRMVITDVDFRERVDSLGHSWGLRGKRRKGTGAAPTLTLDLDELLVNNFHFSSHNAYSRSAFGVAVQQAKLTARLRRGVLRASGTLDGQLSYLRTRAGMLFEKEPVQAWVNYKYTFANRQGRLWNTRATLNGDTIRVSGTHTVDPSRPVGTLMDLKFIGNQPLTEVLHAALPPRLDPYLEGAHSPSKAHIHYTITGLSGPTVTPHNVLTFGLRGASLQWPDAVRRINRWDLQGTYDNGPGHNIKTTVLTLRRCRIYSPAGRLDVVLTLKDFTHPLVNAHLLGRAQLRDLAAVVSPGRWKARGGTADLDVFVRGLLPPPPGRPDVEPHKNVSLRGSVTLRKASFLLPVRGADITNLDVQVGLRDSLWRLSNASGVLNTMQFKSSAVTTYLLDYLTGEHATADITGQFEVDELRLPQLRNLLRPVPRTAGPGFSPTSLPKPRRTKTPRDKAQLAATLGNELFPPGLMLNVGLRCQRLVLSDDTLSDLAVTVRRDGQQVQLTDVAGGVWGGTVKGDVSWPTDPDNRVVPVKYSLGVHFHTLNYRQLMDRLTRPQVRAPRPASGQGEGAAVPALRDLLLMANGQLDLEIDKVELPGIESLNDVTMRLEKAGPLLHMPFLRFLTSQSGHGEATATAQVENMHLTAADADVTLRYNSLDVPRLLAMIASLTTPTDSVTTIRTIVRAERKASRKARREESEENTSLLSNGVLSAVLRVEADQVHYGAIRGTQFRLVSHLLDGQARLDNCSLDALLGHISLSGLLLNTSRYHHPTQVQMRLNDIQLPALFETATSMGLKVLNSDNIRGTLDGVVDLHTDLSAAFLPRIQLTAGYLKTDFRNLELLNVEALMEALKFMKAERTGHLFFEPVSSQFILANGQLLIPDLKLNSNLSNLDISGHYGLDGRSNLYIGLKPLQALFGNNDKRVERIQNGEPVSHTSGKLTYVNLHRNGPGDKYKVRFFQKDEQRKAQAKLQQEYRELLLTQRLDTTIRLVR